ncbi:MAG: phosphatidic acid phosphatase [Firmicutes bacterium]|nr:phosphatidic acid phosphatase [Bacillota bacterium]
MKERLRTYLPSYTYIPLLSILVMNFLVYFGTKFITFNAPHHDMTITVDHMIPFCPPFVIIYVLAFLQWALGYIMIARESKELCYSFLSGELIAKVLCLFSFLLYPTIIIRPEIIGDGIWEAFTGLIYLLDTPAVNLFPSIHCLESWLCFRGALSLKKTPNWYAVLMFIFTALVFASTVLIKQHALIDLPAGILVGEIGLFLSKRLRSGRIFERLEQQIHLSKEQTNQKGA